MPIDRNKLVALVTAAVLAACGSGDPGEASTLGGAVIGLTASGLILELNQAEEVAVAPGATDFTVGVFAEGADFDVRVKVQPDGQTCSVYGGQGKMAVAASHSIVVYCSSEVHKVGGTVSGLAAGESATLALNGETYVLPSAATYTFPGMIPYQAKYLAVVLSAPAGKGCTIANAAGTMDHGDVVGVDVVCVSLCGNQRVDAGEPCDPTAPDSPLCTADCKLMAACGNTITEDGEQCDDGVARNGPSNACTAECQWNVCGDGNRYEGHETCDTGPDSATIKSDCPWGIRSCELCSQCQTVAGKAHYCGDETPDSGHEECDWGTTVDPTACPYGQATCRVCSKDCRFLDLAGPFCGDGTVQSSVEQCDNVYSFACGTCGQPNDPANGCRPLSVARASGSLTFGSSASDLEGTTFTLSASRGPLVFEFSTRTLSNGHVAIPISSGNAFRSISEIASVTATAVAQNTNFEFTAATSTAGGTVRVLLASARVGVAGNSTIPVTLGNGTVSLTSTPLTGGRGCAGGERCATSADCVDASCVAGVCYRN